MTIQGRRRIFITGGSGLLGGSLVLALRSGNEVSFCYRHRKVSFKGANGFRLDLTDRKETLERLKGLSPEVIVHCAALTDVDYCENHFEEARRVNAEATRTLAEIANQLKAKLVYISTESVYDGIKGNYSEEDVPHPANHYAKSKLEGEEAVRSVGGNWLIARTGFEGWRLHPHFGKQSFFEWLVTKFQEGRPISVFYDRYFTPFSVYNLISVLEEVIRKDIQGLFHIEGIERSSYTEFAKRVAEFFDFDSSLIRPVSMDSFPGLSQRPKDTSLNVNRIKKLIQTKLENASGTVKDLKSFRDSGQLESWRKELNHEERLSGAVSS